MGTDTEYGERTAVAIVRRVVDELTVEAQRGKAEGGDVVVSLDYALRSRAQKLAIAGKDTTTACDKEPFGGTGGVVEDEFRWCTDLVVVTQETPLPDDIYSWTRFTVRVAPTSVKDEDGVLELVVADLITGVERLIARATGEFGHAGDPDPAANTGPAPGQGRQYFKIGPHRDKLRIWGHDVAAIHVRNIKRRYWQRGAGLRTGLAPRL